uniref:RAVE complex protein Rav1 C-terminal domain-containing protein n=1 Tax=Ciona savignyi TaxID=51511 RepID=H2YVA9_CIOSA
MKQHQVLTGSSNPGSHCYDIGQISNFTFFAYGSGCDVVVTSSSKHPLQILTYKNDVVITALSCSDINGYIAVAYANQVVLYCPQKNSINGSYNWTEKASFSVNENKGNIRILSWNYDGSQLLIGSSLISLWRSSLPVVEDSVWRCAWRSAEEEHPIQLSFSPTNSSSQLFASVTRGDCMIKVWFPHRNKDNRDIDFTFTYLLHPQPVVGIEWRKNFVSGKLEIFSNVLISSSRDQICRIWCETKSPNSQLLKFQSKQQTPHSKTGDNSTETRVTRSATAMASLTPTPTSSSGKRLSENRHFHLAASINPLSDIPLLPSASEQRLSSSNNEDVSTFTIHWLNNKFHQSRVLQNQRSQKSFSTQEYMEEDGLTMGSSDSSLYLNAPDVLESLIYNWIESRDALFSIHPTDGSLLVWHIDWLDENRAGRIRQPQVCFSSRIPMAFSSGDAATLCPKVILFVNYSSQQNLLHSASCFSLNPNANEVESAVKTVYTDVQLLSKHTDGSLNLWQVSFSNENDFSSITSIYHITRICGHCFHLSGILSHPILPLLLTTASHKTTLADNQTSKESDLILWRVDPVGPLSYSGGLSELTRISRKEHDFTHVSWFPVLFPTWCLGRSNNSPSTALVSISENSIDIYQAVVDADIILHEITAASTSPSDQSLQRNMVSHQSSAHPGCILHLTNMDKSFSCKGSVLLLETFPDTVMCSSGATKSSNCHFNKSFFIVMVAQHETTVIHTWKVTFKAKLSSVKDSRSRRTTTRMSDSSDDDSDIIIDEFIPSSFSFIDVSLHKVSSEVIKLPSPSKAKVLSACSGTGRFGLLLDPKQKNNCYNSPFHVCIACDDGSIYFWCYSPTPDPTTNHHWGIWSPDNSTSCSVKVEGRPILIKAANPTLLACLHASNSGGYVVTIYECASSGGSKWMEQGRIQYDVEVMQKEEEFHLDWLSREEGSFFLAVGYATNIKIYSLAPNDIRDTAAVKQSSKSTITRQSSLDVHTRQKLNASSKFRKAEMLIEEFNVNQTTHNEESSNWRLLRWQLLNDLNVSSNSPSALNLTDYSSVVSWARDGILVVATQTEMYVFCPWMEHDKGKQTANDMLSLSEIADHSFPSLPQYHPVVLSELMNSGHIAVVREILINLAICINGDFRDTVCQTEALQVEKYQFSEFLVNTLKVCSSGNHITPLSLQSLLSDDGHLQSNFVEVVPGKNDENAAKNAMETLDDFATLDLQMDEADSSDDELNEILGIKSKKGKKISQEKIDLTKLELNYFGKEHCKVIHEFLVRNQLPGLSSLDQMGLMALADTLEMTNASNLCSDSSRNEENVAGQNFRSGERGYAVSGGGGGSLDNCGLQYVMALHNHLCLLNSLPASNRAMLLKKGLDSCHFAWAFHSEAEEEMLSLLPSVQRGAPEWKELKSLGVGWWIRSNVLLRRLIEQTARAAFLKKNDPLDSALFYLALKKKAVLCGLFKSVKDTRMYAFFQHNFNEERWRIAALKNAFALMGKQRFEQAVAFFLLSGSIHDAVEVCIEKLKDIQLALVISRVYGADSVSEEKILLNHVLGETDSSHLVITMNSDSFYRSMACWVLGRYSDSVSTLVENIHHEDITDVFNFYMFLRSHPIVQRSRAVEAANNPTLKSKSISKNERELIFQTAVVHLEAGCPILTLDSLSNLPKMVEEPPTREEVNAPKIKEEQVEPPDWSAPVEITDDGLELNWSDEDEGSDKSDSNPDVPVIIKQDARTPETTKSDPEITSFTQDVFANHLRMTACLKIFVQELQAIANVYNMDGGQLRSKLYMWLENASSVMNRIFGKKHETGPLHKDSSSDEEASNSIESMGARASGLSSLAPSLHELILADNQDWKSRRSALTRRHKWLQRNHNFIRTLLSYCNLHDSAFGSLAALRMELLLLLQESLEDHIFGGGVRQLVTYSTSQTNVEQSTKTVHKMRERLNTKLLSSLKRPSTGSIAQHASSTKEKFVPPEISLWDWFLTKPFAILNDDLMNFDSDAEVEDSDDESDTFSDLSNQMDDTVNESDETDPDSYSWKILRFVIIQIVIRNVKEFLSLAGFDINEISSNSSLLAASLRVLQDWLSEAQNVLEQTSGTPTEYLPSFKHSDVFGGPRPAMLRYQAMLEPDNTPFHPPTSKTFGLIRLWHSLVKKEELQETFIKFIFLRRNKTEEDTFTTGDEDVTTSPGRKVKILHKEPDIITAFCMNSVNNNCIALSSSKEVIELDISMLLASDSWAWVEENSTPVERKGSVKDDEEFLFVSAARTGKPSQPMYPQSAQVSVPWMSKTQTGQGANVLLKRGRAGVRRLESHPTLPYYLTGSTDGSLCMWEWGHQHRISQYRAAGQFAKVSSVHFNHLGNKLSLVDGEGFLTLWQVSSPQKSFFHHLVHDRGASDCCFLSSASVIATAGMSTSHRNTAIWDTLMPKRSMLVKDFLVHEQTGSYCLKYLPRYRSIIVGGKNGNIAVFDDRSLNDPVTKFVAHDSPVKCISVDQRERIYATGSTSGDVKIWDASSNQLLSASPNEHARSSLFRNFGFGTVQITLADDQIFTCGADGSLKMKILP